MAAATPDQETTRLYGELEDRLLARDQVGGSRVYYELLQRGRPLPEIMAQAVRIHAPYTHVPYHQRIDDGFPNFVNNDHCLLSARAAINLQQMLPEKLAALPLAQTIWYIPSGLDIWNQKILKAPGHYATRGYKMPNTEPPKPVVYWPDQEPLRESGPLSERLNNWLTLVERGQVIDAYRTFLGLMEETEHRKEVLAQLVFAGLIDVQDRMLYNRSYTTGHKAYRARSVVEIGNAVGWDNAHDVLYAGALDIAVGPRWHSVYEMACNIVTMFIEGAEVHAVPQGGTTERERALLTNTGDLSAGETDELVDALIRQHEPAYIEKISACCSPALRRGASSMRSSWRPDRWCSRPTARTPSRCRSTLTSIATRSAGSTTISSTRSGSSCFTSRARWSIRRPGTKSTWAGSNRNRSARRPAPTA